MNFKNISQRDPEETDNIFCKVNHETDGRQNLNNRVHKSEQTLGHKHTDNLRAYLLVKRSERSMPFSHVRRKLTTYTSALHIRCVLVMRVCAQYINII